MRFLSSRTHGVLDYLTAALFLAAPWLFGFHDGSMAQWTVMAAGACVLLTALMTDYELGLVRMLPLRLHLTLDLLVGLLLAAAPWLLDFAAQTFIPHLVLGAFEVLVSLFTYTVPDHQRAGDPVRS
jgi:hypothetical protein